MSTAAMTGARTTGPIEVTPADAAATAHFYASIPARRMFGAGEFVLGLNTIAKDPLVPETEFVLRDGHVDVPRGPGLGIVVDERALKAGTLLHECIG